MAKYQYFWMKPTLFDSYDWMVHILQLIAKYLLKYLIYIRKNSKNCQSGQSQFQFFVWTLKDYTYWNRCFPYIFSRNFLNICNVYKRNSPLFHGQYKIFDFCFKSEQYYYIYYTHVRKTSWQNIEKPRRILVKPFRRKMQTDMWLI